MKKILSGLFALLLVFGLVACGEKTQQYEVGGLTIALPATFEFKEIETEAYDKCLYDGDTDVAFWVVHYTKEWLAENGYGAFSLEDIGTSIGYGLETLSEKNNGDTYVKSYITKEGELDIYKYATIYQVEDGYWLVVLDCLKSDQDKYKTKFADWMKTVTIKE